MTSLRGSSNYSGSVTASAKTFWLGLLEGELPKTPPFSTARPWLLVFAVDLVEAHGNLSRRVEMAVGSRGRRRFPGPKRRRHRSPSLENPRGNVGLTWAGRGLGVVANNDNNFLSTRWASRAHHAPLCAWFGRVCQVFADDDRRKAEIRHTVGHARGGAANLRPLGNPRSASPVSGGSRMSLSWPRNNPA